MRPQSEVVVLFAREAREVEDDDEVNLALARPAVLQQSLELTAVRGLGALAFLVEAFEDLVALATAESSDRPTYGRTLSLGPSTSDGSRPSGKISCPEQAVTAFPGYCVFEAPAWFLSLSNPKLFESTVSTSSHRSTSILEIGGPEQ
jgi:hypothetical protein